MKTKFILFASFLFLAMFLKGQIKNRDSLKLAHNIPELESNLTRPRLKYFDTINVSGFSPASIGTFQIKTTNDRYLTYKEIYQSFRADYLLSLISKYRPQINDTIIQLNDYTKQIIFSSLKISSPNFIPLEINQAFIKE